jgi:4-alpha-glucanotransferase
MWLQFHLDRQLARAGREIGLITDVPVGFSPDGFDAQHWKDALAPGIRIGVPPDQFFRDGQDWGLPAFDPWKFDDAGWAPLGEAVRAAARHAAGIRLDHVMGLFRLYWIPDAFSAAQGAYVQYPAEMLLKVLAQESRRAGAFVIGEDLGLVEPTVREHLEAKRSLSYRLVWFEESDPEHWPHDAVGAVGTHDLPTIAGIWTLSEPEHRLHPLRHRLVALTGMPDGTPALEVAMAVYSRLAQGPTRIVLASREDALGIEQRPNVPGTVTEMPNWRIALPMPIEDIESNPGALRVGELMRSAGR